MLVPLTLPYMSQSLYHCDCMQLSRRDDVIPCPPPYPSTICPPPFHPSPDVFYDTANPKDEALG